MVGDGDEKDGPRVARGAHARRRERIAVAGGSVGLVSYFKERVYATFTGLAIVLVVGASDHPDPEHAFLALVFGVLGITSAGFVSELVAHLAVHGSFSSRGELLVPIRVSLAAMGTAVAPALLLAAAWIGWLPLGLSLEIAGWIYIATLGVVGLLAVRRAGLRWWQTLIALGMLAALGVLVILLQTVAKSV